MNDFDLITSIISEEQVKNCAELRIYKSISKVFWCVFLPIIALVVIAGVLVTVLATTEVWFCFVIQFAAFSAVLGALEGYFYRKIQHVVKNYRYWELVSAKLDVPNICVRSKGGSSVYYTVTFTTRNGETRTANTSAIFAEGFGTLSLEKYRNQTVELLFDEANNKVYVFTNL